MIEKVRIKTPFRPVYPSPAALIVSVDEHKKSNIMTAGEVFNIGLKSPAIIGIALRKATYTHSLITKTMEFTVNFPTMDILDKVDLVGTISGRNGLDKFAEYKLTALKSDEVIPPIVEECPVNLECKALSITPVGDHDLILGEVVAMHVDADKLDENHKVLIEQVNGFLYAEWAYYAFGEKIGEFGYTRKRE
jgi:Conserved protein/domain typically associated with flavoprotein oxygenases, DIM6/NTAB family